MGLNLPKTQTFVNFILKVLQIYCDEEDHQVLHGGTVPMGDMYRIFTEPGDESKF